MVVVILNCYHKLARYLPAIASCVFLFSSGILSKVFTSIPNREFFKRNHDVHAGSARIIHQSLIKPVVDHAGNMAAVIFWQAKCAINFLMSFNSFV